MCRTWFRRDIKQRCYGSTMLLEFMTSHCGGTKNSKQRRKCKIDLTFGLGGKVLYDSHGPDSIRFYLRLSKHEKTSDKVFVAGQKKAVRSEP